jgi:hypothetical protein
VAPPIEAIRPWDGYTVKSKFAIVGLFAIGLASPIFGSATDEPDMAQIIRSSNACLDHEISNRIPLDLTQIDDAQRSQVRMAAASACHDFDRQLAALSEDVRTGRASVDEASEKLLVTSLSIANAMISTRLKSNAAATK